MSRRRKRRRRRRRRGKKGRKEGRKKCREEELEEEKKEKGGGGSEVIRARIPLILFIEYKCDIRHIRAIVMNIFVIFSLLKHVWHALKAFRNTLKAK